MNIRMLGTENPQFQSMVANGRTYSAAAGQPLDVPDFDAGVLEANSWIRVAPSGPTTARPAGAIGLYPASRGATFFDTTLGKIIICDGTVWRDPATGSAV